jgi:hypothetical protein
LFKAAVKAITRRDPDAKPKTKQRRGERAGGGLIMLRQIAPATSSPAVRGRYAALQPLRAAGGSGMAESVAAQANGMTEDLQQADSAWDVFDITAMAYDHNFAEGGMPFDTKSDHLSPGL